MHKTEIRAVSTVTPDLVQQVASLIPQLSSSAFPPTSEELKQIIASPASTLLFARTADGTIAGILTLVMFRIPTGLRGIIEDVIVDERFRGQGIAEALTREAIARAQAAGARTLDLTSRPTRVAANRLYQKLGFELRESNVYRLSF